MPLRGPVHVNHCTRANSERVAVGPTTIYIYEDGSRTDSRIGCMVLELPAGASGPPMHWHRFHDECFFITKGSVTFVTPDGDVVCGTGEMVTVPPRAVHTFKNASDAEDAEFFMTATPGTSGDDYHAGSILKSIGPADASLLHQQNRLLHGL